MKTKQYDLKYKLMSYQFYGGNATCTSYKVETLKWSYLATGPSIQLSKNQEQDDYAMRLAIEEDLMV